MSITYDFKTKFETEAMSFSANGRVVYSDGEIVIYRKSPAVRVFFGALGSALIQGKAYRRFRLEDVISYKLELYSSQKKWLRMKLDEGKQVSFLIQNENNDIVKTLRARFGTTPEDEGTWCPA